MGGVWDGLVKFGKKVVGWIGNCIERVVSWWKSRKEAVNQITINYIISNQNIVMKADDKETFIEAMAIRKEKTELDYEYQKRYQKLSYNDRLKLDQLLEERDY